MLICLEVGFCLMFSVLIGPIDLMCLQCLYFFSHLHLGLSKYSSSKIIVFCMCFNCDPLSLCWTTAGVVVKCAGVGELCYLSIQSQSACVCGLWDHGITSTMPAGFK